MNVFLNKIRPNVRELVPYSLEHVDARVKLDMNENPLDTPEVIKAAVIEQLQHREWTRYPELVPRRLLTKLSRFVGWPEDGLLVGNGSNEILKTILMAVAGPGSRVTVVQPSFSVYQQLIRITGAEYRPVLLTPELQFDIEAICQQARGSDLTIVCVPNNPTGTRLDPEAIREILSSTSGLVIVDEAYHEFSGMSCFDLLRKFSNLILLRTFSKAMAMAGLRIGYLLADPQITAEVAKAKLPYNLNFVSIAAAEAGLDHIELLQANVQRVIDLRATLTARLNRMAGVETFPSGANFILFRTPLPGSALFESLYAQSVLVRDVSKAPLLDRCLRVTVGNAEENEVFLAAVKRSLLEGVVPHVPMKEDNPGIL
ncbi:MAG: histidinol-phosphate transaminase [Acidobacteriia bacterium]|nr:histidinol-phosphate transaminase [Terriglobia bacterium]